MDLNIGSKSPVSDELLQLVEEESSSSELSSNSELLMMNDAADKVAVRITAADIDALLPSLNALGFETLGSVPDHHFIEGYIAINAISNLETLATNGLLMGVIPVYNPVAGVGAADSQADFVLEADRVRHALPTSYDGTGQTVAVFSDSYNVSGVGSEADDIASGDLPAGGVTVRQEGPGGSSDEGRAMLQLIHDLAPGADLYFSSVLFGEANYAQQIRDAANPAIGNASVLTDDYVYFAEPMFQDGIIAQAIDEVVANEGVTYFSFAGNYSDEAYESTNINFAFALVRGANIGNFFDFDPGPGVDVTQTITLDPGQRFTPSLQWDDPFYTVNGVDTDLDIYLVDSTGTLVARALGNNIGTQTPVEVFTFTNNTGVQQDYQFAIEKISGPDPTRIKYVNYGRNRTADGKNRTVVNVEYDTNSSTVVPHASATYAQAVGAIPFFDQDTPEDYTSQGPSTILFEPDGTRLAIPEIRQTPDIAAIVGTNTTFFPPPLSGSDIPEDLDTFPNFFGTSAAAPHAAAVAALIQQANPGFTPQQVYDALQSTAEDIAPAGFDNVTGHGLINAFNAIFGPVVLATLPFTEDFDDGDLPIAFETNTNGAGRIQVTSDFIPMGVQQLTLDSSGVNIASLNEAILYFDATGFSNITLSFDQKEFDDEDNPMSATFSGSENSDGVALSVDGTNWVRLVDLTGANSTNSFQNNVVDVSAVAAANGLTLGSDVQIKFQQFDDNPIEDPMDPAGFAFDNIVIECFLTGTRILTDQGEIAVENLKIGDLVQTADGKLEPIKWIGRQTIKPHQVKNPLRGYPVLIKAGALGNNIPHRDLYVSPDHSMFVEGLLINAGALVNDISIIKTEPTKTFTYYHIELENHSLLIAEGAAAESYLPQKENRYGYDNASEYEELYPLGSNLMLCPMDYPRISSWNKVPRFVSKKLMKIAHQLTEHKVEISPLDRKQANQFMLC